MSLRGQVKAVARDDAAERMLVVTSGRVNLAIPATAVEGILPPEESVAAGSVTVREIVYPVTDLARRLGFAPMAAAPDPRVVLCGSRGAHRGLRVDQVLELIEVESRLLHPLPPHFAAEERTWFHGYFLYHDGIALRANPDWLVGDDPDDRTTDAPVSVARLAEAGEGRTGDVIELEVIHAEGTL